MEAHSVTAECLQHFQQSYICSWGPEEALPDNINKSFIQLHTVSAHSVKTTSKYQLSPLTSQGAMRPRCGTCAACPPRWRHPAMSCGSGTSSGCGSAECRLHSQSYHDCEHCWNLAALKVIAVAISRGTLPIRKHLQVLTYPQSIHTPLYKHSKQQFFPVG